MIVRLTNTASGLQGVQTGSETVWFAAKQSREVTMTADALRRVQRLPFFVVEVADDPQADEPAPETEVDPKAAMIERLTEAGVKFDRRWGMDRLSAALAESVSAANAAAETTAETTAENDDSNADDNG